MEPAGQGTVVTTELSLPATAKLSLVPMGKAGSKKDSRKEDTRGVPGLISLFFLVE